MDKKVLFALTAKIFNTLKGIGIKPKLGVTTDVKRLPGSRNSLNTDLSTLGETDPESLKRLIANDADFLPQATPDQIVQFNNNLEYLKSTYPETFAKQQVVTEAKTGTKTLVDDVGEKNTLEDFDVKDREPNARGGSVGNLTYKKMFSNLDRTLNKGLGTMFKRKR
jgi:hypothetical protein